MPLKWHPIFILLFRFTKAITANLHCRLLMAKFTQSWSSKVIILKLNRGSRAKTLFHLFYFTSAMAEFQTPEISSRFTQTTFAPYRSDRLSAPYAWCGSSAGNISQIGFCWRCVTILKIDRCRFPQSGTRPMSNRKFEFCAIHPAKNMNGAGRTSNSINKKRLTALC